MHCERTEAPPSDLWQEELAPAPRPLHDAGTRGCQHRRRLSKKGTPSTSAGERRDDDDGDGRDRRRRRYQRQCNAPHCSLMLLKSGLPLQRTGLKGQRNAGPPHVPGDGQKRREHSKVLTAVGRRRTEDGWRLVTSAPKLALRERRGARLARTNTKPTRPGGRQL